MSNYLKANVYVEGGRLFTLGTSESDIPEDLRSQIGDWLWTEEKPQEETQASNGDNGIVAALQNQLADRDAENSQLRARVSFLEAQVQELQTTGTGEGETPTAETGGEDGTTDLHKLKKDELIALAGERGVEIDPNATKDQIIALLQGQ